MTDRMRLRIRACVCVRETLKDLQESHSAWQKPPEEYYKKMLTIRHPPTVSVSTCRLPAAFDVLGHAMLFAFGLQLCLHCWRYQPIWKNMRQIGSSPEVRGKYIIFETTTQISRTYSIHICIYTHVFMSHTVTRSKFRAGVFTCTSMVAGMSENAAQSGLGLSICQAIAASYYSFMWFTTWKITCPKALILQVSYLDMS